MKLTSHLNVRSIDMTSFETELHGLCTHGMVGRRRDNSSVNLPPFFFIERIKSVSYFIYLAVPLSCVVVVVPYLVGLEVQNTSAWYGV